MVCTGFAEEPLGICKFCGEDVEDTFHIVWKCFCWEDKQANFGKVADLDVLPCTLHAGLFVQDGELLEQYKSQVLAAQLPNFSRWPGEWPANNLHFKFYGKQWLESATDGSCMHPLRAYLARAGAGVFYGLNHPGNIADQCQVFLISLRREER